MNYIDESSKIDKTCKLGCFIVIKENTKIVAETIIGNHVSIDSNVLIGKGCYIGENVVIANNVFIGSNTILETGVVITLPLRIREDVNIPFTSIGSNVCIHSKSVIECGSKIEDNTEIDYGKILEA